VRQPVPFGKYLLLERISVGGMAEVFQSKSFGVEGFEKIIAIKRILPSMSEDHDFIQMFIDEAKIAGQLSHANICQIYELGKIQEAHFIAMEYIWGKDLLQIQNRLRKLRQKMPVPMVCFIASKVCEGLDYAHRKKDANGRPLSIIHRDVSPQNILVSYEGEVKLIDFGIAKAAIRSSRTQAGVLKGKFGYMSPEQVRGLPLDRRSDLFAIGTMLWESLTGERLFANDSDFSTLERVRNAEIEPPSRWNPKIPPELERIVLRALARDVEDRFQWANELQDELHQLLVKMGTPYTPKQLASWMKEAFEVELARERTKLEAFKKLGPGGSLPKLGTDDEPADNTVVAPPTFGDADELARTGPRPGLAAAGFGEEGPTEIFGEVASDDVHLARPGGNGSGVGTDPGRSKGGPPVLPLPVLTPESSVQVAVPSREPGAPPVLPLQGPPSAPGMERSEPEPPPPAHPLGSTPGTYIGDTRGLRRSSIARDVAIGAIAAVLFAAMIAGAYFLGTRVLGRRAARATPEPAVAPSSTLVVAVADSGDGEVFVNGDRRGAIRGGEPLTLEGLAPGEVEVRVKRAGMPDCVQKEVVDARAARVATCRFATVHTGTVLLTVLTEGATVLVDKQEISSDAAREPLILTADAPHEITVKKDGFEPQTIAVTVKSGEVLGQRVELTALPPPKPETHHRREPPDKMVTPAPPDPSEGAPGYLIADTTPWAKVILDGSDTNKMTPIAERAKIAVGAGKHTVTFVVGEQRFSYTIMVEPGQDYHLSKQLPVKPAP
jgi:serine/threonine protein kinase